MGKKRIKVIDLSTEKKPEKKSVFEEKKLKKSGKGEGRLADMGVKALEEAEKIKEKEKEVEKIAKISTDAKAVVDKEKVEKIEKALKKPKVRSRRYRLAKTKVNTNKFYSLSEAVKILTSIANSRIDETVEVHISTYVDKLTGVVKLPHGTGKKQKIAIADDKILAQVAKNKINFDVLLASPVMMPKIAKVAKILGPKGLMPNPKTGTISENPEELKKKMEVGQELRFKTEPKAPLLSLVIGKISFGEEKILENLKAVIEAVKVKNIKKAILTSTQSPGIKLDIASL